MAAWLDRTQEPSASSRNCLGGNYQGLWSGGGVACRLEDPGDLRIFWTDSADLIGAIADGPQDDSLIAWWQANCQFVTRR
ncbi:hypothetical protein [Streptomyces sp. NBC_01198]|uniref:hypothetical protein n=1 Tax=Streptomyces sp. NBC_01198 TaxID=2903769 RepID=UPI002E153D86|nr:hypothetical protein OG702_04510 [Streptomyces sp. NBC_01198]